MNELQTVMLDIYDEIKNICLRHNITHYAVGGTCIGAVRHKGFIPWDDDIDIGVAMEDYEKLLYHLKRELPPHLMVYDPHEHAHYTEYFVKIVDTRTTFIGEFQYRYPSSWTGVWVDICPVAGIPKGRIAERVFAFKLKKFHYLNYYRRCHDIGDEMGIRFLTAKRFVKRCFLSRRDVNYYLDKEIDLLKKYPLRKSEKGICFWSKWKNNQVLKSRWFKKAYSVPYEDREMYIPENYDGYLTAEVGDYMTPPPVQERKIHEGVIDLKTPYRAYRQNPRALKKLINRKRENV